MGRRLAIRILTGLAVVAWSGVAGAAVPRPSKVVVVIEENHARDQIIGNDCCEYLTSLAADGANFLSSFAITHPSEPNYIALFSGSLQGVTNDSVHPHSQFNAPNLASKLRSAGLSFAGYSESLPFVGYDGTTDSEYYPYARRHNPWVNWQDPAAPPPGAPNPSGKLPPSINRPFSDFPTGPAAGYSQLPDVSFVVPDVSHDMHDGGPAAGDVWLQQKLSGFAQWAQANDGLLVVTFDEDDRSAGNRIPTVFVGQVVQPGSYVTAFNHYGLLRTLQDMFGLEHHGATVDSEPIVGVWQPPAWHRTGQSLDVDGDGSVVPLDALLIINELDRAGARQLDLSPTEFFRRMYDTDGDYWIAPVDALRVINRLDLLSLAALGESPAARLLAVPEPSTAHAVALALGVWAVAARRAWRLNGAARPGGVGRPRRRRAG